MKNYKKLLTIIGLSLTMTSCLVDDTAPSDAFGTGPNLAGFNAKSQNLSAVADGSEYMYDIAMEVKGPTSDNLSEDVTVNIAVVPGESDAVEGVHYRFDSSSITLRSGSNYLGQLPITVITDGIEAPDSKVLTLEVTSTSGAGNVIGNGNKITLNFVYQCFADLSGTYIATNNGCANGAIGVETTIVADGGAWFIAIGDGGFLGYGCTANPGLNNWARITELCGEILPSDDLQYAPCCSIGNISSGTWDAENGILTLVQSQGFTGNWASDWVSTYVRQ